MSFHNEIRERTYKKVLPSPKHVFSFSNTFLDNQESTFSKLPCILLFSYPLPYHTWPVQAIRARSKGASSWPITASLTPLGPLPINAMATLSCRPKRAIRLSSAMGQWVVRMLQQLRQDQSLQNAHYFTCQSWKSTSVCKTTVADVVCDIDFSQALTCPGTYMLHNSNHGGLTSLKVSKQVDLYLIQHNADVGQTQCEDNFGTFDYTQPLHEVIIAPGSGFPTNTQVLFDVSTKHCYNTVSDGRVFPGQDGHVTCAGTESSVDIDGTSDQVDNSGSVDDGDAKARHNTPPATTPMRRMYSFNGWSVWSRRWKKAESRKKKELKVGRRGLCWIKVE